MQHISFKALELLKAFEGFSAVAYLCPAGKRTIGYGHVVRRGEDFPPGGITRETAECLLKQDVAWAERSVAQMAGDGLTQGQFDALVCLVYNIGAQAFEKSTLLKLLRAGNLDGAAEQFERWVFAGGVELPGLIRRRRAEKGLFLS